jgi:hypothetical protein
MAIKASKPALSFFSSSTSPTRSSTTARTSLGSLLISGVPVSRDRTSFRDRMPANPKKRSDRQTAISGLWFLS